MSIAANLPRVDTQNKYMGSAMAISRSEYWYITYINYNPSTNRYSFYYFSTFNENASGSRNC
jgi:hypothetical protein